MKFKVHLKGTWEMNEYWYSNDQEQLEEQLEEYLQDHLGSGGEYTVDYFSVTEDTKG